MKEQILEKLEAALSAPIRNEAHVVYILGLARKLLEKHPPTPPPIALKLYCHWALHVDLTHPGTTLPLLQRVDAFVASILAGSVDIVEENRIFREFVFLDTFRAQLRHLLSAYQLPFGICERDSRWHKFLRIYAGIIEDGSISCNAKNSALKHISGVTFTKKKSTMKDGIMPFQMSWSIALLNGRKMTVEVNAAGFPAGGKGAKMIVHGIQLH